MAILDLCVPGPSMKMESLKIWEYMNESRERLLLNEWLMKVIK